MRPIAASPKDFSFFLKNSDSFHNLWMLPPPGIWNRIYVLRYPLCQKFWLKDENSSEVLNVSAVRLPKAGFFFSMEVSPWTIRFPGCFPFSAMQKSKTSVAKCTHWKPSASSQRKPRRPWHPFWKIVLQNASNWTGLKVLVSDPMMKKSKLLSNTFLIYPRIQKLSKDPNYQHWTRWFQKKCSKGLEYLWNAEILN